MLFPQLLSGAVAQFPILKTYSLNGLTNVQEDGTRYRSSAMDPVEGTWVLSYAHLTQTEADKLTTFFEAVRGRLQSFTFLDPAGNLIAWSEDLMNPVWEKTPLLTVTPTQSEAKTAIQLASAGAGFARLSQNVPCPATALVCFSMMARADTPAQLSLSISDDSSEIVDSFALDSSWREFFVSQLGSGTGSSKTVSLTFPSDQTIEISSLTLSPQPAPSAYSATTQATGLAQRARFDQDSMLMTVDAVDDYSCEVRITSRIS